MEIMVETRDQLVRNFSREDVEKWKCNQHKIAHCDFDQAFIVSECSCDS